MKNIIAVAGLKNAGKDTVANMLQYCLSVPKFMHIYSLYKLLNPFIISKWEITSFAGSLKEVLSILINRSVEEFNNRDFKENYFINLKTIHVTCFPPKELLITDKGLNRLIKSNRLNTISEYYITIRQLLQIFGTEIIRTYFGNDFWILRTLLHNDNIIISDLRFINEYDQIKKRDGITIYIDRHLTPGLHASEKEVVDLFKDNKFDYIIDNSKDLKQLFNNVVNIVPKIHDNLVANDIISILKNIK